MTDGGTFAYPQVRQDFAEAVWPRRAERGHGRSSPRITLRLTQDEAEQLAFLSAGMSVSAFVRQRVFGEGADKPKPSRRYYRPVADRQALAQALALLGQSRIANNLNQLAYHAHLGTLPVDDETAARIDEAYAFVVSLREALLAALGRHAP